MVITGSNEPYGKWKKNVVDLFPFPSSFSFLPLMLLLDKTEISATGLSVVGVRGLEKEVTGKGQIL